MKERKNKPKVFMSHSKADAEFIKRIDNDLKKCQIDTWIDEYEIRAGKPWLNEIFENGIPTCDSVFIYFTENSIESNMVKKEIDAGIIHQINDGGVALLTYVSHSSLRSKLRHDIQSLQLIEWNNSNYYEIFPIFVSEIWSSFIERTIHIAITDEKSKRREAEDELNKFKNIHNDNIFSSSEQNDFKYIWNKLNRLVTVDISEKTDTNEHFYKVAINLGSIASFIIHADRTTYTLEKFKNEILHQFMKRKNTNSSSYAIENVPDIKDEIMTFGFIQRKERQYRQTHNNPQFDNIVYRLVNGLGGNHEYIYTEKAFRFKYWLQYTGQLPKKIEFIMDPS